MRKLVLALCALWITLAGQVAAGPVLDRILNQMVLDVTAGAINRDIYKTIAPANPIGQTFTTGPGTVEVSRIAVAVAYWHESWTEDESLVLTLWDSPEKSKQIASAQMPYKWRAWEGQVIMFTLNAPVTQGQQYYFEVTAEGGDGTIVGIYTGERYAGGTAYEAGKPAERNIWFEVHSRPTFDRDAAYSERFANWNLNYPGMEKVRDAVRSRDWDAAVDALISYYESQPDLLDPNHAKPRPDPKYDRSYADLVADQKIKDEEGNVVDLGPNWNHYRMWRTRGGVGLTRSGVKSHLAGAYQRTGDEKFARAFNDMMACILDDQPCPLRSGVIKPGSVDLGPSPPAGIAGGSMWGGLSIGARMNQMWYFYSEVAPSPHFTRDVRAAMIFNMVDMANTLAVYKGGGNWEAQMSSALYELADRHPELARSAEWFDKGIRDLFANLMETVYPDGCLREPTYNYHCLTTNRFTRTLLRCREKGIPVDRRWEKRTEKAVEFIVYSTQPDWHCPARGDTYDPIDCTEYPLRMASYYGRDDFLWIGSKGTQGKPPTSTSAQFPIGGWFIMRSDWTPRAHYLNLHNGDDRGHGHSDALSITLCAFGTPIITDPGVYAYGTAETAELSATRSHATVTVDGADAVRAKGPSRWQSTRTMDYYSGTNRGYRGIDGVTHTRKIAFVKPDYWVMSDTVNGSATHNVEVRFPFERMAVTLDPATGRCWTDTGRGNLMIVPCPGSGFRAQKLDYHIPRDGLQSAPMMVYDKDTQLPASLGMLVFPFMGRSRPQADLEKIGPEAYRIDAPSGADYVCFGDTTSGGLAFQGEAGIARTQSGDVRSLAWVDGRSFRLSGQVIATAERTIRALELIYDGDILTISSTGPEPSLVVAALGAKRYRVGTGPLTEVKAPTIRPFKAGPIAGLRRLKPA